MTKFIFIFFAVVFIIFLHFGFLPVIVPDYFYFFNLPLLFIALVAFFNPWEITLFATITLGLFLDLYSPVFLGFYTIVLVISALVIKFFLANFFQHKNFLSLMVANIVPLVVFQLVYIIYYFFSPRLNSLSSQYLLVFFVQLLVHSFFILMLLFLPNPLRRQLRSQTIS
jgi:rod shape-determining protein MreD